VSYVREYDFSVMLVERFAAYHRQATAAASRALRCPDRGRGSMADYNGVRKAAHIREKLGEMIHLTRPSTLASGLRPSGWKTKSGNYQAHIFYLMSASIT